MLFKSGYKITQVFGNNPDYYKQFGFAGHEGIDLVPNTKGDNDLYCVEGGEVLRDVDDPKSGAYGIHVVIWNKERQRAIWYCHLDSDTTSLGQMVKAGDRIGVMGGTGNVTGPHLHLNVRPTDANKNVLNPNNGYKGFVDPLPILKSIDTNMANTITIDTALYEKLVGNSTAKKEVATYLEISNPDDAGADEMKRVIGGYKSRITDIQNQLSTSQAEVQNRTEQVSRLKTQLTETEKLYQELLANQYPPESPNLEIKLLPQSHYQHTDAQRC
jgi:hypothetical protein